MNNLHLMFSIKVFAMEDGQLSIQADEHDSLHRSMCYSYGSIIQRCSEVKQLVGHLPLLLTFSQSSCSFSTPYPEQPH